MKILRIIGIVFIAIILGGFLIMLVFGYNVIQPNRIFINNVSVSESSVTINGNFIIDLGMRYKGSTIVYKNNALYVKIKGGLIAFLKSNIIEISIKNTYGKIDKVYLLSENSAESRLIYPKSAE